MTTEPTPGLTIRPVGDGAVLAKLGDGIDLELAAQAARLALAIRRALGDDVLDVVPAYASVLVRFDPLAAELAEIMAAVRGAAEATERDSGKDADSEGRRWEIGVCFGGEHGPDLADSAAYVGMTEQRFVDRFCHVDFHVAFLGFVAGFPYMLGMPPELSLPRLPSPRTNVPVGSVAIAQRQCGIYPRQTPGGWRLIGRTSIELFDPQRQPAALMAPLDVVRFSPVRRFEQAGAAMVGKRKTARTH